MTQQGVIAITIGKHPTEAAEMRECDSGADIISERALGAVTEVEGIETAFDEVDTLSENPNANIEMRACHGQMSYSPCARDDDIAKRLRDSKPSKTW